MHLLKTYFWVTAVSLAILLVSFLLFPTTEKKNRFYEKEIEKINQQRDLLTAKEKELEQLSTEKEWNEIDQENSTK